MYWMFFRRFLLLGCEKFDTLQFRANPDILCSVVGPVPRRVFPQYSVSWERSSSNQQQQPGFPGRTNGGKCCVTSKTLRKGFRILLCCDSG